jgi:hypothetical protein
MVTVPSGVASAAKVRLDTKSNAAVARAPKTLFDEFMIAVLLFDE